LKQEIDNRVAHLKEINPEELKLNRLLEIQTSWENFKSVISAWQENLLSRSQELEAYGNELQKMHTRWELTLAASQEREDPPALRSRVNVVLDSINNVDKAFKTRQKDMLTLMNQISQESIRINTILSRINEAQDETREKIFAIDSPPLWKAFKRVETDRSILTQMKKTLESRWISIKKFADINWPRVFFHTGIFLIISLSLLNIRRRGDSWLEEKGSAARFKYIYHHPFSSALLFSLILTPYIYQYLPEFMREFNRLLFLFHY
jgi:hypothetical protein